MSTYLKPLHIGISVKNMDESIKWYEEKLDFKLIFRKHIPQLKSIVTFMEHGDFQIELFQHDETIDLPTERLMPNSDIQTQGTKHICFANEDVTGLLNTLKEQGVEIVLGPQVMEGKIMGFIRDLNGILIEFIQPEN